MEEVLAMKHQNHARPAMPLIPTALPRVRTECTIGPGATRRKGYMDVDYDRLAAMAQIAEARGSSILSKGRNLQGLARQKRGDGKMRLHRKEWVMEHERLHASAQRADDELVMMMQHLANHSTIGEDVRCFFKQMCKEHSELKDQVVVVQRRLDQPIRHANVMVETVRKAQNRPGDGDGILRKIVNDRRQCETVVDELGEKAKQITERVQRDLNNANVDQHASGTLSLGKGVPPELQTLECPDDELRGIMYEEFAILDSRYHADMQDLYKAISSCPPSQSNDNWPKEDHLRFTTVFTSAHAIQASREHWIERLRLEMPWRSREDIIEHAAWFEKTRWNTSKRKDLVSQYNRERDELYAVAVKAFSESVKEHLLSEEDQKHADEVKRFNLFRMKRYEELCQWRQIKIREMKIRQFHAQEQHERSLLMMTKEQEKEEKEKQRKRNALQQRRQEMEQHEEAMEQLRLDRDRALAPLREKEKRHKQSRVMYRKQEIMNRNEALKRATEQKMMEVQMKEQQLEKLRASVRPSVALDPARITMGTKATEAKTMSKEEVKLLSRRRLQDAKERSFDPKSYTSETITRDTRFRVAERLHQAGVLGSDHARQVMASLHTQKPASKEHVSTFNF